MHLKTRGNLFSSYSTTKHGSSSALKRAVSSQPSSPQPTPPLLQVAHGLELQQLQAPIGVVMVIFESRWRAVVFISDVIVFYYFIREF